MKDKVSWADFPVNVKKIKKSYSLPTVISEETSKSSENREDDSVKSSSDDFENFSSIHSFEGQENNQVLKIISIRKYSDHVVLQTRSKDIEIRGSWLEISFKVGQRVNIIECPCCKIVRSSAKKILVDDIHNLLTIEDEIIPVTTFLRALECTNAVYFTKKILNWNFEYQNKSILVGTILHSLIESILREKNFKICFIIETLKKLVQSNIEAIYISNSTERIVLNECLKHVKNIIKLKLDNVETEKKIISSVLNLKGKIDIISNNEIIEIKTGRKSIFHKAQIILYGMIHGDYKKLKIFYTSNGEWVSVDLKHNEVRSIVQKRNILNFKDCECSFYCKQVHDFDDFLRILWECLDKEEEYKKSRVLEAFYVLQEGNILTVELQHKSDLERHLQISIPNSGMEEDSFSHDIEQSGRQEFVYKYIKLLTNSKVELCKGKIIAVEDKRIKIKLNEKICLNNYIVLFISVEHSDLFYKTMRYSILNCRAVYQRLLDHFDDNFYFVKKLRKIMPPNHSKIDDNTSESLENSKLYCEGLDSNFFDDIEIKSIENEYPRGFKQSLLDFKLTIPECFKTEFLKLNEYQRCALLLSLNTPFFHLIHGMPGTGKTKIIILLIKILNYYNFSILIVSYTNLSLINIIKELDIDVYVTNKSLDLGTRYFNKNKRKISFPAEKDKLPEKEDKKVYKSVEDMRNEFKKIKTVVSTCFSFSNPIFMDRKFDYLIVDEGSQIHFPLALVPISLSKKFVVFGDHLQLKPLIFKEKALSLSLFESILDKNKSELKIQYRMPKEIMNISNFLFYQNMMLCGVSYSGRICFIDSNQSLYNTDLISLLGNMELDTVILCYFNMQVNYLRRFLKNTIETIDRYQGSEAENLVIIFDPVIDCEIIRSPERLNVALTRAKKTLTMIGNRDKMSKIELLGRLLRLI